MKQYTFSSYIGIVSAPTYLLQVISLILTIALTTQLMHLQFKNENGENTHKQRKSLSSMPVYRIYTEYTEHTNNYMLLTRSYIPAGGN